MKPDIDAAEQFSAAVNTLGEDMFQREDADAEHRHTTLNRNQRVVWGSKSDPSGDMQNPAMTGLPARSRPSTKIGHVETDLLAARLRAASADRTKEAFIAGRIGGATISRVAGGAANALNKSGLGRAAIKAGKGALGAGRSAAGAGKSLAASRRGFILRGGVMGAAKRGAKSLGQSMQQRGIDNRGVQFLSNLNPNAKRTLGDNVMDAASMGWTAASDYSQLRR